MSELVARLTKIENEGCKVGAVHGEAIKDHDRRIEDGEKKFNWLVVLIITVLLGMVGNLLMSYANLNRQMILQTSDRQKMIIR